MGKKRRLALPQKVGKLARKENQGLLAETLEVSERTLRNWRRGVAGKTLGRPAVSKQSRYLALLKVRREVKKQGWQAGWRPLYQVLSQNVSLRLTQESLSALKKRHEQRLRKHRQKNRMSVEVHGKDVIWVEDSTHLGRLDSKTVMGELLKDRGTLANVALEVGGAVCGNDVVTILEARKANGRLPLVWATDNGPAYKSWEVDEFCRREKIIHLFSKPHTPQDNASAERGIGELKAEAGLGKGVALSCLAEAASRLARAERLLCNRPRASKGNLTSLQLEKAMPEGPLLVDREGFYSEACRAMENAVQGGGTGREKRQRERLAIYRALQQYGLITIKQFSNRGGNSYPAQPKIREDIL